eukprot:GFKZ01007967.1.p1 GENE.GFKZ01007967.1~~GFKZ01007967.1.p1  ORF type:complete len:457 (-),score=71.97 GFKZ01007967.1:1816-3186(-)
MYDLVLAAFVVSTFVSHLLSRSEYRALAKAVSADAEQQAAFSAFQSNYLAVYLLAVAADWLQGPYVYALYSHYGYSKNDIGKLYIAGFASSAVFGTFVASVADKFGRRSNALLYAITYITSCLTKHSPSFHWLLFGRVLGGVGYSILWSAFESWMVYEHTHRDFDPALLSGTFSKAQFWNGVVAICAGQTSGWFAARYGKVMPFDVSIFVLLVLAVIIIATWTENYGNADESVYGGFSKAWRSLMADEKILLLGVSQSAFEGAMYIFTFVWTPALQLAEGQKGEIPHGTIFSSFMAATMIGSNLFAVFSKGRRVEVLMRNVFAAGAILFALTSVTSRIDVVFASFLMFEVLCGIYFPGMATMRAPYIPEESRSALLTFFRIPLNIIVVIALYEDLSISKVFFVCATLLVIAVCSQQRLIRLARFAPDEDADSEKLMTAEKALTPDLRVRVELAKPP